MEPITTVPEPQGIPFFSIKTGETHWCKLEPTISAYINSSDMGINASRDQDYGWRLAPEWVKKVRLFKRDRTQMSILTAKNEGRKPTTTQILYYMYGEELADYYEAMEENENPFEEAYMAAINSGATVQDAAAQAGMPLALADFRAIEDDDDIADLIDEVIEEDDSNDTPEAPSEPTAPQTPPEEPKQPEAPSEPTTVGVDPAKPGEDKTVVTPPKTETKPAAKASDKKPTQK